MLSMFLKSHAETNESEYFHCNDNHTKYKRRLKHPPEISYLLFIAHSVWVNISLAISLLKFLIFYFVQNFLLLQIFLSRFWIRNLEKNLFPKSLSVVKRSGSALVSIVLMWNSKWEITIFFLSPECFLLSETYFFETKVAQRKTR